MVLVDDEPDLTNLAELVEAQGYPVTPCPDAISARQVLSQALIDLVITEMASGGVDGFELLMWVKEHSPSIHVVLLTGHVSGDCEAILLNRRADGHLVPGRSRSTSSAGHRSRRRWDQSVTAVVPQDPHRSRDPLLPDPHP